MNVNAHIFNSTAIPNRATLKFLLALIPLPALLNLINILVGKPFGPFTRHIDLDSDTNVAAWFSSVLLAVGGFAAALYAAPPGSFICWPR